MSVVVIGLNHHTAPLDLLERMTVDDASLGKALHDVAGREHVSEAVVLSTCNRTEVYVVAEKFHGAYRDLRDFLAEVSFLPPEDFADHLYVHYDDVAVEHLFTVAAGLDSDVVGEAEILGQVRTAWERAQGEGCTGVHLNGLFRHAVEVGKRARTETGISRHIASVSTAAVAMARERLGGLAGRSILVLGAGDMGEGMVRALVDDGVADVRIANRTWDRAVDLADRVGGRAIRLAELATALAEVDLLLTSTGATSIMLEHTDVESVLTERDGRPVLIVDVAVPRDVDPAAATLPGVTLLDMDDLRAFAEAGLASRQGEVAAVRGLVDEEVDRFLAVSSAREVAPLIAGLHERGEAVRSGELDRFRNRLAGLDERQLEAVEALTKGIVAKLLHDPTVGLKDAAGTAKGERLAESLRDLFDL
ncbi:MAG: glutamyl-tRNA reductase [Acidimicrobiales bacterium]